jgi:hypothetical protein
MAATRCNGRTHSHRWFSPFEEISLTSRCIDRKLVSKHRCALSPPCRFRGGCGRVPSGCGTPEQRSRRRRALSNHGDSAALDEFTVIYRSITHVRVLDYEFRQIRCRTIPGGRASRRSSRDHRRPSRTIPGGRSGIRCNGTYLPASDKASLVALAAGALPDRRGGLWSGPPSRSG